LAFLAGLSTPPPWDYAVVGVGSSAASESAPSSVVVSALLLVFGTVYAAITVVMGGRPVTGIRGIKYNIKKEKELLYAKGNRPHAVQSGNYDYNGEITLLQSEYLALREAAESRAARGSPHGLRRPAACGTRWAACRPRA